MSAAKWGVEAAVIANGEWPGPEVMDQWLNDGLYTAVCDGAAARYVPTGRRVDVIIGDGDSLSASCKEQWRDRWIEIGEQETNDLTKAVRLLRSKGFQRLVVLGATGRRDDHTLGNISLLPYYLQQYGVQALLPTDYGLFIPCRDKIDLPTAVGQQISVFRFGATQLQSQGLRYALRDFVWLWEGSLNEAVAPRVRIEGHGCFLVYLAHEIKASGSK